MKLPYRLGDSFAFPLGNGQFARSCIVQCEHRVVVIRVAVGDESQLDLRVSDDALVLHRWKRDGRVDLRDTSEPRPENRYWMHAVRAQRIVAAALGAPHPRERKLRVREVLDDNATAAIADLDDDCMLTLTERVSHETLDRVCSAIFNHPGITIRLHGDAAAHLETLSDTPMSRLSLASAIDRIPPLANLRYLDLAHTHALAAIAEAVPNIESLRIGNRGQAVHPRDLASLQYLRSLDLSVVDVRDAMQLGELRRLTALRLNRVSGVRTMDCVSELPLHTLAIEHLYELERIDSLARIAQLEQLELAGLWQFDIAHVEWTLECERLVRAELDIGGRRKNIELYRRANWAYPWRFPG